MEKRDIRFDVIRSIAVIMVLANHTIASEIANCSEAYQQMVCAFAMVFSRLGVPLFLMLSGALLLDKKRDYSLLKSLRNRIMRIFFPFVCWSMIYFVLFDVIVYKDATLEGLLHLVYGPGKAGHLWYLYVMVALYLLLPFFSAIVKQCSEKMILYLIAIWFIFSGIYQFFREMQLPGLQQMYTSLHVLNGMWGYMFLGWYIKNTQYRVKKPALVIAALLFAGCVAWLVYECRTKPADMDFAIVSYSGAPIIMIAGIIFASLMNSRYPMTNKLLIDSAGFISRLSFGIYLNQLLARAIANRILDVVGFDGTMYAVLLFCVTSLISVVMAMCVDKLSRKHKYIRTLLG